MSPNPSWTKAQYSFSVFNRFSVGIAELRHLNHRVPGKHYLGVWNKIENGIIRNKQGIRKAEQPRSQWCTTRCMTYI